MSEVTFSLMKKEKRAIKGFRGKKNILLFFAKDTQILYALIKEIHIHPQSTPL